MSTRSTHTFHRDGDHTTARAKKLVFWSWVVLGLINFCLAAVQKDALPSLLFFFLSFFFFFFLILFSLVGDVRISYKLFFSITRSQEEKLYRPHNGRTNGSEGASTCKVFVKSAVHLST